MPDLLLDTQNQILTITLNRVQVMNAFTGEMVSQIRAALENARRDRTIRVVLLRGQGAHFCTGADVRFEAGYTLSQYRDFVSEIQDITRALQNMDAVSIAVIQGYCLGGGMELACACDLRIASDDAQLGFPEVALGLTTTSGIVHLLPRLVGITRAKEMMLTGAPLSAQEAERIRLLNRVVPRAELESVALALADQIKSRAPLAIATQKHLLDVAMDSSLDATLRAEVDAILTVFASRDGQEGMRAFIEKRAPQFTGE